MWCGLCNRGNEDLEVGRELYLFIGEIVLNVQSWVDQFHHVVCSNVCFTFRTHSFLHRPSLVIVVNRITNNM